MQTSRKFVDYAWFQLNSKEQSMIVLINLLHLDIIQDPCKIKGNEFTDAVKGVAVCALQYEQSITKEIGSIRCANADTILHMYGKWLFSAANFLNAP